MRIAPLRAWQRRRRARQADVFLLSFPKTGRTWVRELTGQLLAAHFGLPELARLEQGEPALPRHLGVPRVHAKHDGNPHRHTAAQLDPDRSEFAGVKVILLVRDLRDALVSNWFQLTHREGRDVGDFGAYLRNPVGSTDSALRYYAIWATQRHVPRELLLLRYEDLQAEPATQLRRVAALLGLLEPSEATIAAAVEHASFEAMRRREAARPADGTPLAAGRAGDPDSFKTRRGKVGGFRDYLSPADIDWLDARLAAELDPWYGYGRGET